MREPQRHVRVLAVMAFLFVFWLTLCVGTVILVGGFDFEPRSAALIALAPSVLLAVGAAAARRTRDLFAKFFYLG